MIERFDIVYLHSTSLDKRIVKRVIAFPDEEIEYIDEKLYIDGDYNEEPFLIEKNLNEEILTGDFKYIVSDGLFVLGDNRRNSTDSRVFGEVSFEEIFGKRGLRIYPLSHLDRVK